MYTVKFRDVKRGQGQATAIGSGGALKLPQWVQVEPGRQTYFGAFEA